MEARIEKAKFILNNILTEWDEFSTHIGNFKEEELKFDLFTQIDLLIQIDEALANLSGYLFELEESLEELNQIDEDTLTSEEKEQAHSLDQEIGEVMSQIEPGLETAWDTYDDIAEKILRRSQDRVNELVDIILEQRQRADSSHDSINLALDEENELRELRDSLEAYREIRLETVDEEEDDPILDQLDSQIVACDSALLIDESSL